MTTSTSLKDRLKDENFWLRLPFMLLFFVAWRLTELALLGVILVQLCFRLLAGQPQPQLQQLGSQLSLYIYQVFRYLTFNSETKPFPFSEWPETEEADANPYNPQVPTDIDAGATSQAGRD